MPVVLVVLVEPEGDAKKLLRVTLPLGVSLQAGTRVIIDNGQPFTAPYVICLSNGCMAEYEAKAQEIVMNSVDANEGVAAFVARRDPEFKGW